jgi:uroporphyrinogen-III synthase
MLEEGKYCEILDNNGNAFCLLKVFDDKSHNLKIVAQEIVTGEYKIVTLHSQDSVRNLYEFLKKHFEDEKFEKGGKVDGI